MSLSTALVRPSSKVSSLKDSFIKTPPIGGVFYCIYESLPLYSIERMDKFLKW